MSARQSNAYQITKRSPRKRAFFINLGSKKVHPFTCVDTIRGLTDAIHHYMTEGAGTERNPSRADQGGLVALIDQLQHHVHQLHAWLIEIENSTSLELPISDADFETLQLKYTGKNQIKEPPPPLYGVR